MKEEQKNDKDRQRDWEEWRVQVEKWRGGEKGTEERERRKRKGKPMMRS